MASSHYKETIEVELAAPNAAEALAQLGHTMLMASPLALNQQHHPLSALPALQQQPQYMLPEPQQNGQPLPQNLKKRMTVP